MDDFFHVCSVVGAASILIAFFCLQRGWWSSQGKPYLWFNLIGAAILTAVAVYDRRAGFILLEVVWAGTSAWGIIAPSAARGRT